MQEAQQAVADADWNALAEQFQGAAAPQNRPEKPGGLLRSAQQKQVTTEDWQGLADLFPVYEPTGLEKASISATNALGDIAKAPELAGKFAEFIGVPAGLIERHLPAVKALADKGRKLQEIGRQAEDPRFAAQDIGSQLARGAGSMLPFAAAGPAAGTFGVMLAGAAQTAVPMYEDVLANTGDERKAWAAAAIGLGLGATEALGAGEVLAKVDRASAGTFRKALLEVAVSASEEALQEWFQQGGQEIATKALSGQDIKYLQTLESAGKAGLVGGILGGVVSGVQAGAAHIAETGGAAQQPGDQGELTPMDLFTQDVQQAGDLTRPEGLQFGTTEAGKRVPLLQGLREQPAAASEPAGQGVPAAEPEPSAAGSTDEPATPDEAARGILEHKYVSHEELTPEVIKAAVELRHAPEPAPGSIEPTPGGEAQAAPTTEAVQGDAGTAKEPGALSPEHVARARELQERYKGRLSASLIQRELNIGFKQAERVLAEVKKPRLYAHTEEPASNSSVQPGDKLGPVQAIAIDDLHEFNPKKKLDKQKVAEIKAKMERGEELPPVIASYDTQDENRLIYDDGSHRAQAARELGFTEVPVRIVESKQPTRRVADVIHAIHSVVQSMKPEQVLADVTSGELNSALPLARRTMLQREGAKQTEADVELAHLVTALSEDIGLRETKEEIALDAAQTQRQYAAVKRAQEWLKRSDEFMTKPAVERRGARAEVEKPAEAPKKSKRAPPLSKADEENVEVAGVSQARTIVRDARANRESSAEVFDAMLELYKAQPKLQARTSTSKELQAYSTPLPLAWAASELAEIKPGLSVYEPTAGNGALLIGADTNALANELDPARAASLRTMGFENTTEHHAVTGPLVPPNSADRVIANPPFGKVLSDHPGEKHQTFFAGSSGFGTKEIDHAIAIQALATMKDGGKAVLLLGGKKPFGDNSQEARTKQYRSLEDQRFWKLIYDQYNVVDHFTVDGKLYDRQGAAWPVDVVVINGRGKSALAPPYAAAPRILETWNEVRELLPDARLGSAEGEPDAGGGLGEPEVAQGRQAGAERLPRAAPAAPRGPGAGDVEGGREGPPGRVRAPQREGTGAAPRPAGGGVAGVPAGPHIGTERGEGERGPRLAEESSPRAGRGSAASNEGVEGLTAMDESRAAAEARGLEKVNDFQSAYRPKSTQNAIGTLVPANMQEAMDRALERVSKEAGGSIDSFVAKKLGYAPAELGKYFAAEQVDALALAISNVDRGAGFIIGDQTGVGKGRFVAAMLRYAQREGKIPILVTAKPGLFADMRRDLADIGMPEYRQFVTNTNLRGSAALELPNGEKIESLPAIQHAKAIQELTEAAAAGASPKNFDAVFTTYDQMNPVKGEQTARNAFLRQLAPNAILVLDESHLAGGSATGGFMMGKGGEAVEKATRSQFFRDIVDAAHGVVYSSATYAKNPHVMSLYTRTDMGLAVDNRAKLPELIEKGGVPLQQAVASMLVDSGQMARREKSWDGISMGLDVAKTPRASAEAATQLLSELFRFDLQMKEVREKYIQSVGGQGGGVGSSDSATGEGGAKTGGFSSVMHNVIAQMLLSLKAREVGRQALAMAQSGKKPIIALSNTMEGVLNDTVGDAKVGDAVKDFGFGKVFERYLERTREVTIRKERLGPGERQRIGDADMGPLLAEWEALKGRIGAANLGDMPASPIDAIIHEMEAGGLKVGEITGRQARVDYDPSGSATLAKRESSDAAKKRAMRDFNNGDLDALIINQAGSTGYSLHASPQNGSDVKPRHMFVVQADPNIDVFMQMLGRINRTGQTSLPGYTVLVSDLPSEKRPAAILMRKMASLNANTTASRSSAVSLKNVVDFMNVYGDQTLAEILNGEPEIAAGIDFDDEKIKREMENENLARRATGYLPLLPIPEQERVLDLIESNYNARLQAAKEQGENLLEAEVHDLRAKRISSQPLVEGTGSSPFTRAANLEQVEASRTSKPLGWDDIQARARAMLGVDQGTDLALASKQAAEAMRKTVDDAVEELRTKTQAAYKAAETKGATKEQLEAFKTRWAKQIGLAEAIKDRSGLLTMGRSVTIESSSESRRAYVVGIEAPKKGNPLAPSNWNVVLAPVDADNPVRIPISRLMAAANTDDPNYVAIRPSNDRLDASDFPGATRERREKRWIVTGNLLSGYEKLPSGQIGFYTDDKGALHQGILLPRSANPVKALEQQPVKLTPAHALTFLDSVGGFVESDDGLLRVHTRGLGQTITISAKTKGGKGYYLSQAARTALGGDFESRRGKAEYSFSTDDRARVRRALEVYQRDLGTQLVAKNDRAAAREITGEKAPLAAPELPDIRQAMAFPGSITPDIKAGVDKVLKKLGYIRNQQVLTHGVIPTETWTEREIRRWQDSWRGIKTLQTATVAAGGSIDDATDAYLQEELRRGRTKSRLDDLQAKSVSPLLAALRKGGISPEEFGEALNARHAAERNAIILARDPKNAAGSGMTDADADAILDRIQTGKRAAAFDDAFQRFDRMIADTRSGWVRDGLKSQEDVDELEQQYPHYAPLRSDLDEDGDESPYKGTGRGVDVRGGEFKAATGRHTRADARAVLAYAFVQAESAIVRGEKNRVAQSFLNFVRANEATLSDFATISPRQIKRAIRDGLVKTVYDPRFKAQDNVIAVHEGDAVTWLEINPKYQNVADGLKNLGAESVGALVRLGGGFTRYLAGVSTRYNPVFPLFNGIRDAATAFIHSSEHGIAFATRTVRDAPLALLGLAGKGGAKWKSYADEYRRVGAPVSFLDLSNFTDQLKRIDREVRAHQSTGVITEVKRGWATMLGAIEHATDIGENAVRLSAYVHAREDLGLTAERAASFSKNLTVNFERKGDNGAAMNALYMFANAGVQSTSRVAQAIRSPAVRRLLAAAAIGLMGWDQLQRMLGGTDDDGRAHWDKIPSFEKRHNFIFMYPDGSGRRVTIPTPFTYDLVQTIAQQLSGTISGDVKPGAALGEVLGAAVETFDPIGSGNVDLRDAGSVAEAVTPTAFRPILELATNRDWKGDQIRPPADYGGPKANSARYWPDRTSATSIALTSWLNRATGGDELKGGAIDLSPAALDHWASFLTGGLGRTLSQVIDVGKKLNAGEPTHPRDYPAANRLLRGPSPFASTSEFRQLKDALSIEHDRAKRDRKLMPRDLGGLWREANSFEAMRGRRQKAIDKLDGEPREIAQRELDTDLQRFNARARTALLTTDQ